MDVDLTTILMTAFLGDLIAVSGMVYFFAKDGQRKESVRNIIRNWENSTLFEWAIRMNNEGKSIEELFPGKKISLSEIPEEYRIPELEPFFRNTYLAPSRLYKILEDTLQRYNS